MEEIADQELLSLFDLWDFLVKFKKVILLITLSIGVTGFGYAITSEPLYRAQVLMVPVEEESSNSGMLSSLQSNFGSMAGIGIGRQQRSSDTSVAILKSRTFLEELVNMKGIKQELFYEKWDEESASWIGEEPSDFKAYYAMKENVISISENVKTNVFTFSVVWRDPQVAYEWANIIIERLNTKIREQALIESEKNISYLNDQILKTNVLGLQNALSRMIEGQLHKSMMANAKEQYAFKIIDPASIPGVKFSPNRTLILILSLISGVFIGILVSIILNLVNNYKLSRSSS